jgi:hypothetical protein
LIESKSEIEKKLAAMGAHMRTVRRVDAVSRLAAMLQEETPKVSVQPIERPNLSPLSERKR